MGNRGIYYKYRNVAAKRMSEKSFKQYESTITDFLDKCVNDDITKINIQVAIDYINTLKDKGYKPSTINWKIEYLTDFFKFLNEVENTKLDISKLSNQKNSKNILDSEAEKHQPLTIEDIIKLRNQIHEKRDTKKKYIFEMIYRYGLSREELSMCNKESYNENLGIFDIGDRVIELDEEMKNFVKNNKKVLNSLTSSGLYYQINMLGKLINKKLNESIVIASRNQNFFRCPICGKEYENLGKYWALLQYEEDAHHNKVIVCRKCAMSGGQNE